MQALPGFRDFPPEDCAKRSYIFMRWREVARRYGFVEWEGPPLELTELYRKKSGEEIVHQLFNFIDKGEREVALRPELTPTLARVAAAHEREFKKPLKWFSIGQFFRYEKQQRGRLREHFQLNCDIIGEASLAADIELIALAIDLLRAFGFSSSDVVVRISDRSFWIEFLKAHNVPEERWPEMLQAIDSAMIGFTSSGPRRVIALVTYIVETSSAAIPGLPDWFYFDRVGELVERGAGHVARGSLMLQGQQRGAQLQNVAGEIVIGHDYGLRIHPTPQAHPGAGLRQRPVRAPSSPN